LDLAEQYNNSFAEYLKKELPEYFIDQVPDLMGNSDAINNGITAGSKRISQAEELRKIIEHYKIKF
jgi:hypothetical protein